MAWSRLRVAWLTAVLGIGALADAPGARAEEPGQAVTLVDERFEEPRPIPVFATYDRPPSDLEARVERGERWHLVVERGSSASAEVVNGAAVVRIESAGAHWYAVQLAFLPVQLEPRRAYTVTFRGRAERPVVTTFDLAHVGGDWHSYSGQKRLELGEAWAEYEVRFTTGAAESEAAARFEFNFGRQTRIVVSIDDVRVLEEPIPSR